MQGRFLISLDFELMWGVRDVKTIDSYGEAIKKVHLVLPRILTLLQEYDIKATIATVGFLFSKNERHLNHYLPKKIPQYVNQKLSPYDDLAIQMKNFQSPYYWCSSLIDLIQNDFPEQEIATHTFSHYYCLEEGQTDHIFEDDLISAINIAKSRGVQLRSIIFPRNQVNEEYLEICKKYGITSYRGVEYCWFYQPTSRKKQTSKKRAFRLIDSYFNISGHNTFIPNQNKGLVNLPASRFLRPYSKNLKLIEGIKINRIKASMSYAAKKNEVFHLWWHPHNFSQYSEEMLNQLRDVLEHFKFLKEKFSFQSSTMAEVADEILQKS